MIELVGKRISDARKAAGLTQKYLAKLTGVTPPHVCKIESEKDGTLPSLRYLKTVAEILGLTTDFLLGVEHVFDESGAIVAKPIPPDPRKRYVYFIEAIGTDRIKIGRTKSLDIRSTDAQTMCPYPIELLGYIESDHRKESEIHKQFSSIHLHGEWHQATPELRQYIQQHSIKQ